MTVEQLHQEYRDAFNAFMDLHTSLPYFRTPEQQKALDEARNKCVLAKQRYQQARFWAEHEGWAHAS